MNLLALSLLLASSSVFLEPRLTGPYANQAETVIPDILCRAERIVRSELRHGSPVAYVTLRNTAAKDRSFTVSSCVFNAAKVTRPDVNIPANGTVTLEFPTCRTDNSLGWDDALTITETTPGAPQAKPFKPELLSPTFRHYSTDHNILIDGKLSREAFEKGLEAAHVPPAVTNRHTRASTDPIMVDILALNRSPEDWPTDWRVYSTFDAVVFTPETHAALPDAVRQALADYASFGGTVETLSAADLTNRPKMWDVTVRICRAQTDLCCGNTEAGYSHSHYSRPYSSGSNYGERLKNVPLAVERTVPIGLLIVLLGLFAVILVPATIYLCMRRNRRLSILVILPGASVVLAVLIGLIALITYGLTPTQRLQSVTYLNQVTHHALTRGQFAVFSPRDVTEELAFPTDAALEARDATGEKSLILTDKLYPRGCWVKPLTACVMDFSRTSRQSEKLDVKRIDAHTICVANLLGAAVEEGWLISRGDFYRLERIAPGETVTLTASARPPRVKGAAQKFPTAVRELPDYGGCWSTLVTLADPSRYAILPAETYVVRLAGSPFFPSPFGAHKARGTIESIVIGTLSEEAK